MLKSESSRHWCLAYYLCPPPNDGNQYKERGPENDHLTLDHILLAAAALLYKFLNP
jgi:hypothetical protein